LGCEITPVDIACGPGGGMCGEGGGVRTKGCGGMGGVCLIVDPPHSFCLWILLVKWVALVANAKVLCSSYTSSVCAGVARHADFPVDSLRPWKSQFGVIIRVVIPSCAYFQGLLFYLRPPILRSGVSPMSASLSVMDRRRLNPRS